MSSPVLTFVKHCVSQPHQDICIHTSGQMHPDPPSACLRALGAVQSWRPSRFLSPPTETVATHDIPSPAAVRESKAPLSLAVPSAESDADIFLKRSYCLGSSSLLPVPTPRCPRRLFAGGGPECPPCSAPSAPDSEGDRCESRGSACSLQWVRRAGLPPPATIFHIPP